LQAAVHNEQLLLSCWHQQIVITRWWLLSRDKNLSLVLLCAPFSNPCLNGKHHRHSLFITRRPQKLAITFESIKASMGSNG
jgi:hypothetical protein